MTGPAPRRLIIDARNRVEAAGQLLLGLSLLQRMIRAARRSGFGAIVVLARAEEVGSVRPLVGDEADVVVVQVSEENTVTVRVPADLVAERKWLEQLAQERITQGVRGSERSDIFLFGAGATPEQIAAADTAALGEPIVFRVPPLRMANESDRYAAEKRLLNALVKDSDGFMSRYFARPISIRVSRQLAPLGVTPNQMTIVCALIGLAAAPFFLSAAPAIQTIGGLLFVIHSVLDGCDGELARLT